MFRTYCFHATFSRIYGSYREIFQDAISTWKVLGNHKNLVATSPLYFYNNPNSLSPYIKIPKECENHKISWKIPNILTTKNEILLDFSPLLSILSFCYIPIKNYNEHIVLIYDVTLVEGENVICFDVVEVRSTWFHKSKLGKKMRCIHFLIKYQDCHEENLSNLGYNLWNHLDVLINMVYYREQLSWIFLLDGIV